jgi:hypothetical protein
MRHERACRGRAALIGMALSLVLVASVPLGTGASASGRGATSASTEPVGSLELLTDPFLQLPGPSTVTVAWFTGFRGTQHHVLVGPRVGELSERELRDAVAGRRVPGVRIHPAGTTQLSRAAEDPQSHLPADEKPTVGIERRQVFRHAAAIDGLPGSGAPVPYRVVSVDGDDIAASGTFALRGAPKAKSAPVIMLTSDHQAMVNTPANVELAARTITDELGGIDAVFFAGDLVNIPDRASEWFDDQRGSAFFAVLQGNGGRVATDGRAYQGAEIIQNAPIFPAIGNHEVQGRIDGHTSLSSSFDNPVPLDVAEAAYDEVAATVNPTGDPAVKARWIEDNSFSTATYEEIFSLPRSGPGGERYYATTFGAVRLVTLYSTRIWRNARADADPAIRSQTSRYQEARTNLDDPLLQGHGEFIFEDLALGSEQHRWLAQELRSPEFRKARYTVVMLHEGPHGLGDNAMPHFADPQRIEERDAGGALVGVRYEYPAEENVLLRDVQPLLEEAGVDLVYNGHSHLWNRFLSDRGVNYLEASNTGNSYGAFHPLSGRFRPGPPAPWDAANHLAQGNPGGLGPLVPTIAPLHHASGSSLPFVADNRYVVFQALDTGTGLVSTWYVDMGTVGAGPVKFDQFEL